VQEATAPIICVLHADTLLPDDAVAVMRRVFADPGTALAGFTPFSAHFDFLHCQKPELASAGLSASK
jgi:hypothetical protein